MSSQVGALCLSVHCIGLTAYITCVCVHVCVCVYVHVYVYIHVHMYQYQNTLVSPGFYGGKRESLKLTGGFSP